MAEENPLNEVAETPQKSKCAGIAGWIIFFAIWGVILLVLVGLFIFRSTYILRFCPLILKLTGLIVVVICLWDLIKIIQTRLIGLRRKLVNITVVSIGILVFLIGVFVQRLLITGYALICGSNLSGLIKAMMLYSNDNEQRYPPGEKWCDLLIEKEDINPKQFCCPGSWTGRCHYAMNPNCEPNSPADIVLLFETNGGWNQHGGPELLTLHNHAGYGVYVGFNDGHARFVKPQDIGKLKWKAEDSNGVK
jgi:hypothetical protein